jgi:molecular chaperone GrpE
LRKEFFCPREEEVNTAKTGDDLQDTVEVPAADKQAESPESENPGSGQGENGTDGAAGDPAQELAAALEEVAVLRDKLLRMAAENENFKKRVERERLATLKYAGEHIFREILPVVDNLERALSLGVIDGADAEKNLSALLEGVQLTLKSLMSTLEKFEVRTISSVGKPFDPKDHEAMSMDVSSEVPASHVLTEFEKGYYYKDRLLRAAKVIVSSGEK